jgi:uncharacterized SAM-dependent methyltransferase
MKVEVEFYDGSTEVIDVENHDAAWAVVHDVEKRGHQIISAWRDDEPWFGLCTDMREGQP